MSIPLAVLGVLAGAVSFRSAMRRKSGWVAMAVVGIVLCLVAIGLRMLITVLVVTGIMP